MGVRGEHAFQRRNGARRLIRNAEHLEIDTGDGLRLHIDRSGTGPPLVLLHGFTGSTETWAPLRASLDEQFTTLAVDLPGHGRSGVPTDEARFALSRFADDLGRILDTLGVERVALLGYSMGGRAALRFALLHPGRVAALVLESTSPGIADPVERAERVASDRALADMIESDGVVAFVDRWERLPLWASQAALPNEERARLHTQRLANRPSGLANSLRGAGAGVDAPSIDRLSQHRVPTLLVAGALDPRYVALARLMEAKMPRAHMAIIADAGHAVHLERLAEFGDVIARFLDGLASEAIS